MSAALTKLITRIINKSNGAFSSRALVLDRINDAQNELLSVDCQFMRVKPDPFLITTGGVFEYPLPLNIRRVTKVYTKDFSRTAFTSSFNSKLSHENQGRDDVGNIISRVPFIFEDSTDPFVDVANIIFPSEQDPGSTTDQFLMVQYQWPEQVTSEASDLTIPTQFHYKVLMDRVMQDIEEQVYGRSIAWEKRVEKNEKKFLRYTNEETNIDKRSIKARPV